MAYTTFMTTCMLHFLESCPWIIPANHTTNRTHDFEAMFWNILCTGTYQRYSIMKMMIMMIVKMLYTHICILCIYIQYMYYLFFFLHGLCFPCSEQVPWQQTLGRPSPAKLQTTLRGSSSLRWTRVCSLRDEHLSALKNKVHQESSLVSEVWGQWVGLFWGDILRTFYPFRCSMFRYLKNDNVLSTRGVIMNHAASEDSPRKEADVCSCLHRKWCAFQSSLLLWLHVQIQKPTKIALEMRAIFWLFKIHLPSWQLPRGQWLEMPFQRWIPKAFWQEDAFKP